MSLPNKVDIINNQWQRAYDHFRERLRDRYKIDISFKEYVLLTKERIDIVKHDSKNKSVGIMMIHGKEVLVVKERHRSRFLSTALPYAMLSKIKSEVFIEKK